MLAVPPRSEVRARPLTTQRLLLAPLDASDARDLWTAVEASRPELEPWLPWVPFNIDVDSSARYADASAADWDGARACRFSIRDRGTHRLLGVIGLEQFAHLHENVELGYWLRTDSTRRGLMTEAARACLDFAFGPVNAHRVRVAAATNNHASLAVIRRLGFRFEGIAREAERCHGRWLDHAIFALLAKDAR
ncbi:MAG: GNAT family N-acetyltransferase [Myxococcales bacterium]|nr:GNAT family N-acetyltransferase [Myxococcales bacterium]